jgi:hypothetical protein
VDVLTAAENELPVVGSMNTCPVELKLIAPAADRSLVIRRSSLVEEVMAVPLLKPSVMVDPLFSSRILRLPVFSRTPPELASMESVPD